MLHKMLSAFLGGVAIACDWPGLAVVCIVGACVCAVKGWPEAP